MSTSLRALTVVVALMLISACGSPRAGTPQPSQDSGDFLSERGITIVPPGDRKDAPDLAGNDLEGNPISADQFKGKTLVVNVWGSWCPPCRKEAPALIEASRNLKPDGVEFLGIAIRESAATSKAFTDRLKVPYPSISDESGKLLVGFNSSLPTIAVPTTYVIDTQGRVAARILDRVTVAMLTGVVEDVLKEQ